MKKVQFLFLLLLLESWNPYLDYHGFSEVIILIKISLHESSRDLLFPKCIVWWKTDRFRLWFISHGHMNKLIYSSKLFEPTYLTDVSRRATRNSGAGVACASTTHVRRNTTWIARLLSISLQIRSFKQPLYIQPTAITSRISLRSPASNIAILQSLKEAKPEATRLIKAKESKQRISNLQFTLLLELFILILVEASRKVKHDSLLVDIRLQMGSLTANLLLPSKLNPSSTFTGKQRSLFLRGRRPPNKNRSIVPVSSSLSVFPLFFDFCWLLRESRKWEGI